MTVRQRKCICDITFALSFATAELGNQPDQIVKYQPKTRSCQSECRGQTQEK